MSMSDQSETLLGKATIYPRQYDPGLLFGIDRDKGRKLLGIDGKRLPFTGADTWTCYELSWLDQGGKPHVGVAEITVPCDSLNIIESKSLKLYLNSLNEYQFNSEADVKTTLSHDLGQVCQARVSVEVFSIDQYASKGLHQLEGVCLDDIAMELSELKPGPELLSVESSGPIKEDLIYSHLLKSNCPVTGQPDWASVQISYRGQAISHQSLLTYIVSFRHHQAFHEDCVENIFIDIKTQCRPESLTVIARYTRRGGLDINPWRSTEAAVPQSFRLGRQ